MTHINAWVAVAALIAALRNPPSDASQTEQDIRPRPQLNPGYELRRVLEGA